MTPSPSQEAGSACLRLDGELTIYRAGELKQPLLDAVRAAAVPAIDLADVTEIDTAGVQLLLMARREAAALGRGCALQRPSAPVREAFEVLELALDGGATEAR